MGGKGRGHPSQPGPGSLSRTRPRKFETGFPDAGGGAGAPKLRSALGILLRGDPLAADFGARKRISVATLSKPLCARCVQLVPASKFALREAAIFLLAH